MAGADDDFEELYKYYPGVLALLRRLGFSSDESHDLAQEVYVRVLKGMKDYRGEAHWAYLVAIARRVAYNKIRDDHAAKRTAVLVSDDLLLGVADEKTPLPDAGLEQEATGQGLRDAIASLPANDRTVLLLQLDGLSYEDMVAQLGLTLSAVKSRLNAARKRLKELLSQDPGKRGSDD